MVCARPPARCRALARVSAAAAASVLLLLPAALPARAATAFTLTGDVGAPLGMATDHDRDRYWVVGGGAGGRLTLHAFAADGTPEGTMNSRDTVTNVQAVAYVDGEAWVGDVGGTRAEVSLWNVAAPWPGTEVNHAVRYRFAYPDGAHAAEAILVDAGRRIHVVTTGDSPGVYAAPENPPVDQTVALTRVADAPAGVTDGVVLADGRPAVRTGAALIVLDPATWAATAEEALPAGQQGQSLTQAADLTLALAGAGAGGEVESLAIPGVTSAQPSGAATATPGPRVEAAEAGDTRTFDQTGTSLAVAGAAGLAVLAMVVVAVKR